MREYKQALFYIIVGTLLGLFSLNVYERLHNYAEENRKRYEEMSEVTATVMDASEVHENVRKNKTGYPRTRLVYDQDITLQYEKQGKMHSVNKNVNLENNKGYSIGEIISVYVGNSQRDSELVMFESEMGLTARWCYLVPVLAVLIWGVYFLIKAIDILLRGIFTNSMERK